VTRAWEFLLGLLVAVVISQRELRGNIQVHRKFSVLVSLSIGTLVFVLVAHPAFGWSQFVVSSVTAFATAAFIYSLPQSALNKQSIFGNRMFQAIGNSSYSIYLWHWIAVAVAEDVFHPANAKRKSALVLLSVVPAFLSYRFVEIPFRGARKLQFKKKMLLAAALVVVPVTVLWGLEVSTLRAREDYGNVFPSTVLHDCDFWNEVCEVGNNDGSKSILLLGDSHAYQMIPIFQSMSLNRESSLTTCVKMCFENNYSKIADQSFLKNNNFDLVISMFKTNTGTATRDIRREFAEKISLLAENRASKYLVILDNPFYESFISPRRIKHPQLTSIPRSSQILSEEVRSNWSEDAGSQVFFYDTFEDLCSSSDCWVEKDGKILFVDNNHLSMVGVRLIEPGLKAMVNQILGN
jgi:hypothetical protein